MSTVSTVAQSGIDICSRALILIGASPITSFADGTTESQVAVNVYEDIAQASLVNSRWRFATNQRVLNQLTDKPTGRWAIAHQLPTDMIMLHALTVNDNIIEYGVYGDKAFSDSSTTDEVIADYTFRAQEADWPSYFTLAVEYSLGIVFATSIARDASLATLMQNQAERAMAKARTLDSQQQTTRKLTTSRFITNRRS
ncbi:MAG: hypothetical protein CMM02_19895 [Rhodopirellula sp.]|nr:hypothetical protein [Rhodopirellula sp.]MAT13267.1 hypothetical protein [Rhodopirellula sp.]|tara:strand:+ start:5647 stop:6240 length:594 start_codon:yes stop_codon:yes gene_type:complete